MGARRIIALAMGIALASACGGKPPEVKESSFSVAASFNPVKECSTSSYGRYVRGATCPNAELLFFSREPSAELQLAGMRSLLDGYGHASEDRPLRINGRDVPTLFYSVGPAEAPLFTSYAFALDVAEGEGSIEVQCFERKGLIVPKRCTSLLDSFIQQGLLIGEWPSVLPRVERQEPLHLDVAGRDVRLPRNCVELGMFDVECHEGHVGVHQVETQEKLNSVLDLHLRTTKDDTVRRDRVLDCVVEGVTSSCHVREYRLPFGDLRMMFTAALMLRGVPTFITCDAKQSKVGVLPGPICIQFFQFEEGILTKEEETL